MVGLLFLSRVTCQLSLLISMIFLIPFSSLGRSIRTLSFEKFVFVSQLLNLVYKSLPRISRLVGSEGFAIRLILELGRPPAILTCRNSFPARTASSRVGTCMANRCLCVQDYIDSVCCWQVSICSLGQSRHFRSMFV